MKKFLIFLMILSSSLEVLADLEVNMDNLNGCWSYGNGRLVLNSSDHSGFVQLDGLEELNFRWYTQEGHIVYRAAINDGHIDVILNVDELKRESFVSKYTLLKPANGEITEPPGGIREQVFQRCIEDGDGATEELYFGS